MGQEYSGTVIVGGQKVNVRGDFGSDRVRLSGGKRGDVPYKGVEVVSTTKGILRVRIDGTILEFDVGSTVDRLANKIRKPATRLEKMGIKAGLQIALVGPQDKSFVDELRRNAPTFTDGRPTGLVDVLVYAAKSIDDLADIPALAQHLEPDGGLWVVYRKGKRDPAELDVIAAGRQAGLKDIKIARFSETHTAMKFVLPLEDRDDAP